MDSVPKILFSLFAGSPEHGPWVVACLEGAWTNIVGGNIARACRPVAWKNHCLVLEILDPVWEPTLLSLKGELLEEVRRVTDGEVRKLTFRSSSR